MSKKIWVAVPMTAIVDVMIEVDDDVEVDGLTDEEVFHAALDEIAELSMSELWEHVHEFDLHDRVNQGSVYYGICDQIEWGEA